MKITLYAALVALALAFAPLANAAEGGHEPFPFSAGPLGTTHTTSGPAGQAAAPHDVGAEAPVDAIAPAQGEALGHGQAHGQTYGGAYGSAYQQGATQR